MTRVHRKRHQDSSDDCKRKGRCGHKKSGKKTDTSSTDLTYLCDDHHHRKRRCSTSSTSSSCSSSSSSSSCSSTSSSTCSSSSSSSCRGCDKKCSNCVSCISCGCRDCSDYSRSSVLGSLGSSSDICCDLSGLAKDKKRKCRDLKNGHKKSDDSCHDDHHHGRKGKKFVVTFGPKEGSQWADYNTGNESIYVNSKNGPILHLYRGNTYFFCVEQGNTGGVRQYSLILSDSPAGGPGSHLIHNSFAPLAHGCGTFKIDAKTPRYFYYQTNTQAFMGGLVIVHDRKH